MERATGRAMRWNIRQGTAACRHERASVALEAASELFLHFYLREFFICA
jgi:hypothetical protein